MYILGKEMHVQKGNGEIAVSRKHNEFLLPI